MLFNSLQFLVFFPVVTILYFVLPHHLRWALLLVASCYFYMALIPVYILVLFFLIGVDYIAGLAIERAEGLRRRSFLMLSLAANLGVLFFFKYFNFFNSNIDRLADVLGYDWPIGSLRIILPIGLSFHTFQSISYTIEVYLGRQKAERHLGIYALYVLFYPQLVAGPIERPQNLLHQLRGRHDFDYRRVAGGLKLMAWGLFKKVVIADRLAAAVNMVYDDPTAFTGAPLILATYYFAIQIYCDFSGYSDIAIGAAQVMGIRLMDNFNRPYGAESVADFWKRWHISLSTWFRDYLYIPLGGNRVSRGRWFANLFIVFLVSGLWHGAAWTYVVWGALHGLYLIASIVTAPLRHRLIRALGFDRFPRLLHLIRVAVTFNLVSFAWIFFRARRLSNASYIVGHLFRFRDEYGRWAIPQDALLLPWMDVVIAFWAILFMELVHLTYPHGRMRQFLSDKPAWFRWPAYYLLAYSILFLGSFGSERFIYFQF
jgi:D-alanyl-lipoteichoic acid acyltransferase DltB (MBOAT superfamily)